MKNGIICGFSALSCCALITPSYGDVYTYNFDRPSQEYIDANAVNDYTYNITDGQVNDRAGIIENVHGTYDSFSQRLTWEVTFGGQLNGNTFHHTDGFWLVLTPGALPIASGGQTAQLFFDAADGNAKLTGYGYNGLGNESSFRDGSAEAGDQSPDTIFSSLNDFAGAINSVQYTDLGFGASKMSFDINASVVNSHLPMYPGPSWDGVQFSDLIGVWMHPLTNINSAYNVDGYLDEFSFARHGWLDGVNQEAPLPGALAMLAAAGLLGTRRRRD